MISTRFGRTVYGHLYGGAGILAGVAGPHEEKPCRECLDSGGKTESITTVSDGVYVGKPRAIADSSPRVHSVLRLCIHEHIKALLRMLK